MPHTEVDSKDRWLTPAECAKHTGLTVRALRVYERYGLLAAKRADNDWRYYGAVELERLNKITVLKSIGMTLAQIRELLQATEPSLERVLEIQVKAWKSKKADAERGLLLAETALKRIQTHRTLSIDEICRLIRGTEGMSDQLLVLRELLSQTLTLEEKNAVMDFMKANFDPEQVKQSVLGASAIFKKLRRLMEEGAAPDSPEVQRLIVERNQLSVRCGDIERALKTIEWNKAIGIKFFAMEVRTIRKMRSQPEAEHDPRIIVTPKLLDFFQAAYAKSPWVDPVRQVIADAQKLLCRNPDPTSEQAQALVTQFRDIYKKHSLGDPLVHAKLVPYWEALNDGWPEWAGKETQYAWLFLAEAIVHSREAM